jgi:hypothetical protein
MSDSNADSYLRVQEQMEGMRGTWDNHWSEVARLVRPNQDLFNQWERTDGDKRTLKIFDDTAQLALPKFAAAVISMAFPATQTYHRLMCPDEKLQRNASVQRWFETVNNILFRVRYSPHANFQSQSGEVVLDLGAFGNGILFIDDVLGLGIRYKSVPLPEAYFSEDPHGSIDRLHRRFQFTAHQAMTMFDPARLSHGHPPRVREGADDALLVPALRRAERGLSPWPAAAPGARQALPLLLHRARHAHDRGRGRVSHVPVCGDALRDRAARGVRPRPGDEGPADDQDAAGDDEDDPARRAAGRRAADHADRGREPAAFDLRSNALNHGYVDDQGRPRAVPFNSGSKLEFGKELIDSQRAVVNDAFLVTLFRILVDEPQITATEAMLRAQEKGQLLAPTMGRAQSELLSTCVERELDILMMNGALPPMPRELIEAGGQYKIEYQSPLNQAQRAGAGIAILQTLQAVTPLASDRPVGDDAVRHARERAHRGGVERLPADRAAQRAGGHRPGREAGPGRAGAAAAAGRAGGRWRREGSRTGVGARRLRTGADRPQPWPTRSMTMSKTAKKEAS